MARNQPLNIVHSESSWGWGGQEVRILTESRGMLERGHQVRVLCTPESTIFQRACEFGVPVETVSLQKKSFSCLNAVRKWLNDNRNVDVVNTHSSIDSWLFGVASRTIANRPRLVRTRHVGIPVPNNVASNWLYRSGSDFVVTCGVEIVKSLSERNGVSPNRLRSIPTGVDTQTFVPGDRLKARQELELPTDRKLVGIVAALRREKGHAVACEALAQMARDDFDFVFVGDGLSKDNIENKIKELNISDRIHRVGHQQNVVPWLQALDLFVLPSYGSVEGVPQSIMQAMSCRLPVISTTAGSICEAVDHEETGLIVTPEDSRALADAINLLLDKEPLREQYAEAGYQKAIQKFPIDFMLDRMEDVFYSVLESQLVRAA